MSYEMKYPVRMNVRMDDDMHDKLRKQSHKLNMSTSAFIRYAIESVLSKSPKSILDEFYSREL